MSTPAAVFKALKPEMLRAYFADRATVTEAFDAKVQAFKETVGGRDPIGIAFFDGGWSVTGYRMTGAGDQLLPGWRRDGKTTTAVPAKRIPEGKSIAETLAGLRLPGDRFPGVPGSLRAGNYEVFPRTQEVGEEIFLTLSREPSDPSVIDAAHWIPVKLSEYHAALEAAPEPTPNRN